MVCMETLLSPVKFEEVPHYFLPGSERRWLIHIILGSITTGNKKKRIYKSGIPTLALKSGCYVLPTHFNFACLATNV